VTQPQLYQSYATEKIVSFFGAPGEAESFCNGQWLIFRKSVICLAHVGKGPERSFFENGSQFYWVADQPYHVNNIGTYWHIVPAQVVGSAGKERAIHLFARPPDSPGFLYLGEIEPSYVAVAPRRENHRMACFALRAHFPVRCGFGSVGFRWAIWILRRSIGRWIRCGARPPSRIASAFFGN
jgi:hypothetical protein